MPRTREIIAKCDIHPEVIAADKKYDELTINGKERVLDLCTPCQQEFDGFKTKYLEAGHRKPTATKVMVVPDGDVFCYEPDCSRGPDSGRPFKNEPGKKRHQTRSGHLDADR